MRVLLVHLNSHPRLWTTHKWDLIVDLGWAPIHTYRQWEREFRCPAVPFQQYCPFQAEIDVIRDISAAGASLTDDEGINWWELFVLFFNDRLRLLANLSRFCETLSSGDEIFITGPCLEAEMLRRLANAPVHLLSTTTFGGTLLHYVREIGALPMWELRQIFWDKYDPAFRLRRRFVRKRHSAMGPVILAPSAYVNASKMAANFAAKLPASNFLLVTTRASGRIPDVARNLRTVSLGSYARGQDSSAECASVLQAWRAMQAELNQNSKTSIACSLGLFDDFSAFVRRAMKIRNAWLATLESEQVQGVLCCDNNPYTLLPVLLAKRRGIPTVSCHHGALDWRYRVMPPYADVVMANSKMEQDYLSRVCGIPEAKIQCAASKPLLRVPRKPGDNSPDSIVFFSEPYEGHRARGSEIYKDLLPPLADIAIKEGRKLVVKLHPFESARKRKALVQKVLSAEQEQVTTIMSGALTPALLKRTWFGVTVLSTVAMECDAAEIPCFLCRWLEYPHQEYGEQFRLFGVGHSLDSSAEISEIPYILEKRSRHAPPSGGPELNIPLPPLERLFGRKEKAALPVSWRVFSAKGN